MKADASAPTTAACHFILKASHPVARPLSAIVARVRKAVQSIMNRLDTFRGEGTVNHAISVNAVRHLADGR
jgi:hypothetical protein